MDFKNTSFATLATLGISMHIVKHDEVSPEPDEQLKYTVQNCNEPLDAYRIEKKQSKLTTIANFAILATV